MYQHREVNIWEISANPAAMFPMSLSVTVLMTVSMTAPRFLLIHLLAFRWRVFLHQEHIPLWEQGLGF